MISIKLFILCLIGFIQVYCKQVDYLPWQSFTGKIPENAVPGGFDENGNPFYIGRAYIKTNDEVGGFDDEGYLPGTIIPGVQLLYVTVLNNVYQVTDGIEILTAFNSTKVEWVPASVTSFPALFDTDEYRPVRSGWEFNTNQNFTIYLGKVRFESADYIGKIFSDIYSGIANRNTAYYPFGAEVLEDQNYSALIYYL